MLKPVLLAAFLAFGAAPALAQAVPATPMHVLKKRWAHGHRAKARAARVDAPYAPPPSVAPCGPIAQERRYLAQEPQPAYPQGYAPPTQTPRGPPRYLGQ